MYIVRWLMGHPIIAAWFLAAIAILLNYGSGEKAEHSDVKSNEKTHMENEAVGRTSSVADMAKSTADSLEITSTSYPEGLDLSNGNLSDNTKATIEVQSGNSTQITASSAEKSQQTDKKTTAVVSEDSVANTELTKNTIASLEITNTSYPEGLKVGSENVVDEPKADKLPDTVNQSTTIGSVELLQDETTQSKEISDLGQMTTEEMLLMAREAYWNNGLDEASQIYQELIKLEPRVIEHRGELGNVYWRQGYPKKAAELYSEIALPMIEQGEADRVANMIGFIGLFFPDRASEIHQRLQSAKAGSQETNK